MSFLRAVSQDSIRLTESFYLDINICRKTKSTAVGQAAAYASVTQRARVRSPVGTSFLGEVFSGVFPYL